MTGSVPKLPNRKGKFKVGFIDVLGGLTILGLFAAALWYWTSLPILVFSQSRAECVRVLSQDPERWSCTNLPPRYELVFVE